MVEKKLLKDGKQGCETAAATDQDNRFVRIMRTLRQDEFSFWRQAFQEGSRMDIVDKVAGNQSVRDLLYGDSKVLIYTGGG